MLNKSRWSHWPDLAAAAVWGGEEGSDSAYLLHLLKEEDFTPSVAPIDFEPFVFCRPWIASERLEKWCVFKRIQLLKPRNAEFSAGCDRFIRPTRHNVVTFVWLCSANCICRRRPTKSGTLRHLTRCWLQILKFTYYWFGVILVENGDNFL